MKKSKKNKQCKKNKKTKKRRKGKEIRNTKNGKLEKFTQSMKSAVDFGEGIEAFYESFPQLVLQGYTLLYGYEITTTQLVCIIASLIMLSKSVIQNDILMAKELMEKDFNISQTTWHTVRTLPCYLTTIVFRILAFCLTISCLGRWSWMPMIFLFLELGIVSYIRYRNEENKLRMLISIYDCSLSNCGVLNVYSRRQNISTQNKKETNAFEAIIDEFIDRSKDIQLKNEKERRKVDARKFVRLSAIVSFLHHSVILGTIMILARLNPDYWSRAEFDKLILKPGTERFYWVAAGTMMTGLFSTILQLYVAATMVEMNPAAIGL